MEKETKISIVEDEIFQVKSVIYRLEIRARTWKNIDPEIVKSIAKDIERNLLRLDEYEKILSELKEE